jgi:hypothetical protein
LRNGQAIIQASKSEHQSVGRRKPAAQIGGKPVSVKPDKTSGDTEKQGKSYREGY